MKRVAVFAVFSVAVSVACDVSADTVLWHRFDERAPGETAQSTDVLTNAVSDAYGSGAAYSIDAGTTPGSDPDFMPKYGGTFFAGNVYDPLTGTVHTNRSSISFRTAGTSSALAGGAVRIPTSEEFVLTNFTVECFVCTTGGVFNLIAPIVGKPNGGFMSESWQIGMLTNGKLFMRYNRQNSGTSGDGSHRIDDGVWHHVAMTCSYDKESDKSTYRMYVDYELDFTKELAGATGYGANSGNDFGIYVGGYLNAGRKFNGAVDELRITDTALGPDEFLRREVSAVVDEDTLIWLPLDEHVGSDIVDRELNRVVGFDENGISRKTVTSLKTGDVPDAAFSPDVIASTLRADPSRPPLTVNTASLYLQTNGTAGSGSALKLPAYPYTATNLTVEMFFKTAGKIAAGESQTLLKFTTGPILQVTLDNTHPGSIIFVYSDMFGGNESPGKWTSAGSTVHGANLDDGKWHHVAIVYDAENTSLSLYIDYVCTWTSNEVLLADLSREIMIGCDHSGSRQFFHGWLDSVRVTQRALESREFLDITTYVFDEPDDVMFHASLNGHYEAFTPVRNVPGYGETRGYEGCEDPVFSSDVKYAELLLDGSDGVNSVTNESSLFMNGSLVNFCSVEGVGAYDQTVELFCKLSSAGRMSGLVRLNTQAATPTAAPVWALYFEDYEGTSYLRVRYTAVTNGVASSEFYIKTSIKASDLCDEVWHHIAMTVEYDETEDVTLFVIFIDGCEVWRGSGEGKIHDYERGNSIALGASVREYGNIVGFIDEVRISRGILTPDRFMRRYRRPRGTVLTVR